MSRARARAPRAALLVAAAALSAQAALPAQGAGAEAPPDASGRSARATQRLGEARAHRLAALQLEARSARAAPDAPPGAGAAELFAAAGRESGRCAEVAREAWSLLSPAAAAELEAGAPPSEALRALPPAAQEPLYLEAACAADAARADGVTALVSRAPGLRARLERAAALDPGAGGAGPERALAALLAQLPAAAGGDLAEARARFELALARAPGSVETLLLFARTVAVKQQDRALFESLLAKALAAAAPAPADLAAQELARALLGREDELFGPRAR